MKEKENKGITLVALVVTIVVLLILAGVTISMVVGDNGLITKAREAKNKTEEGATNDQKDIEKLYDELASMKGESYSTIKHVNRPNLKSGMTPIKFTEATSDTEGQAVKTNASDDEWYNYEGKHWANAQTKDGSMWVWIPRFAYKVNASTKTFDIVFLVGESDAYYDEKGVLQNNVKRATADFTPDTTSTEYYTLHPAFANESSIEYTNGGWDKELTGIWVAKFEAGYASGGNSAPVEESNVKYTQKTVSAPKIEVQGDNPSATRGGSIPARNWLDGVYGDTETAIKYPTFQGSTYSMNYINHGDAYSLCKDLISKENIYGLQADTDSHLMKNSEWGAVAYLSQSKYGLNGTDIAVNKMNKNNGGVSTTKEDGNTLASVYAVTGYNANSQKWNQNLAGKASASTTGNIYGIYDLSGGVYERTAAYIANGNENLAYGNTFTNNEGKSTKYATVYPHDAEKDKTGVPDNNATSTANYEKNTKIYGDAVRETSTEGIGANSWYGDYSSFPALGVPFFTRGGYWGTDSHAGLFSFYRFTGVSSFSIGFRAVLV